MRHLEINISIIIKLQLRHSDAILVEVGQEFFKVLVEVGQEFFKVLVEVGHELSKNFIVQIFLKFQNFTKFSIFSKIAKIITK